MAYSHPEYRTKFGESNSAEFGFDQYISNIQVYMITVVFLSG